MFSKDTDEECAMHSKSDNIEIMTYDKADKVTVELFESIFSRYKTGLKKSLKGSDFVVDCVDILYNKCYKINLRRGRSHLDSPDWMKNKKNNNNYCQ